MFFDWLLLSCKTEYTRTGIVLKIDAHTKHLQLLNRAFHFSFVYYERVNLI